MGKKKTSKRQRISQAHNGKTVAWFELMAATGVDEIRRLQKGEGVPFDFLDEHRVFVRGNVGDMVWIEVPRDMPPEQIKLLGQHFADKGIHTMIMSDQINFVKMRLCSEEEAKVLDDADEKKTGQILVRRARSSQGEAPGELPGDGPEPERDGSSGHRSVREAEGDPAGEGDIEGERVQEDHQSS